MNYFKAITAIFKGLGFCLSNPEIRKLAMWPWLVGVFFYFASIIGAFYLHPILLDWAVGTPEGWWQTFLYYISWTAFAGVLLVASMLVSVTLVLIFTSVFQTAIASKVLVEMNRAVPVEAVGVKGVVKETGRTIFVEASKLIWLLPLLILVFIIGFIPLFTPIAFLLGSWLLAYQFIDIVLDVYKLGAVKRFGFASRNGLLVTTFGATLFVCWAIPFVGLLLPPAAVAGASWLLSETNLIDDLEENVKKISPSSSPPTA